MEEEDQIHEHDLREEVAAARRAYNEIAWDGRQSIRDLAAAEQRLKQFEWKMEAKYAGKV